MLPEHYYYNNSFMAPYTFCGTTQVSQYKKGKTNLDLLEQETVSGSGNSWAICKSALCPRQITMPAPHHSIFYRPVALPAAQPTASKHSNIQIHNMCHILHCSWYSRKI